MEKTKVNPHPKCNFRPHTFAQSEHGCPLDHCGYCGGHVTDAEPCHAEVIHNHHEYWLKKCKSELFEMWLGKQSVSSSEPDGMFRDLLWQAFLYGWEGKDHEYHEYNLGDCGQDDCPSCHAEFDNPEPYTGWDAGA